MQEVFGDGTVGEVKTANSLEELLPEIRKSLADPKVKYVKVFNAPGGKKVTAKEELKSILDAIAEHGKIIV